MEVIEKPAAWWKLLLNIVENFFFPLTQGIVQQQVISEVGISIFSQCWVYYAPAPAETLSNAFVWRLFGMV